MKFFIWCVNVVGSFVNNLLYDILLELRYTCYVIISDFIVVLLMNRVQNWSGCWNLEQLEHTFFPPKEIAGGNSAANIYYRLPGKICHKVHEICPYPLARESPPQNLEGENLPQIRVGKTTVLVSGGKSTATN